MVKLVGPIGGVTAGGEVIGVDDDAGATLHTGLSLKVAAAVDQLFAPIIRL